MKQKLSWLVVIVVAMALGGAAVVAIDKASGGDAGGATSVITRVESLAGSTVAANTVSDVSGLYDKVSKSVVRITGQSGRTGASGLGSGVVLDKQGHILTNN